MTKTANINIPAVKQLEGQKIKVLEALNVGESVNAGDYSADNMRKWSGSISYYKRLKGNSKKVFSQRQDKDAENNLIITLYRTK